MTALAYICLIAGAWQLAGCVMRLVDRLEGRGVKKTCRCRGVKKTCRWHVFSPDRGGCAAAASIRDCTALSFSPDRGGYAAAASIRTCTAPSFSPDRGGYAAAASIGNRKTDQRRADVGIGPYERKRSAK